VRTITLLLATLTLLGCDEREAVVDAPVAPLIDAGSPPDALRVGVIDGVCAGIPGQPRVLVYTYENQWRHVSNYYARGMYFDLCASRGFHVESSNDTKVFNATQLAAFDVVVFAVTSGSGIDDDGKRAFEAWVRNGGGVIGYEAASATEQGWPFYVAQIGASFLVHPPTLERGTVRLESTTHPITAGLPTSFEVVEQWYVFASRPENVPGLQVLLTLDESTLPSSIGPEFRVGYHAIGWVQEREGGRVFYTGLGDNPDVFREPTVIEMSARAVAWVARRI
jgi:type 1 glutamine amidotransferase